MDYKEFYSDWAKEVGIYPDAEGSEVWEHQQKKIDHLLSLIKTYKDMPYPCHDWMTREQWEEICHICHEKP